MSLKSLNLAVALNLDTLAVIASDEVVVGPFDLQNEPSNAALNIYLIASVTATDASPAVFSSTTTAPADGTAVLLKGSPAPFVDGQTYFVVNEASTTFELSLTQGGTPISSSAAASGIDVYVYPYSPILPVTASANFNSLGTYAFGGTPAGAGETPFLPDYSAVLYTNIASMVDVTDLYVEGSDDESTWHTYSTISGNGAAMTFIPSLYRYIRVVAYDVTSTGVTGTLNVSLLGDA